MESEKLISVTKYVDDEENDKLKIGVRVCNEEEAYRLYCEYAIRKGFSVRKGRTRYSVSGVIRQREFSCSNAGSYLDGDPYEPKKVKRLVRRTGCSAFIRFTIIDDAWEITNFNDEHNHDFVIPEERQFLRINRSIDIASASVINSMMDAGLKGVKTYSYLTKEVGGPENVGFTQKDCQNFMNQRKKNLIERGDAQSVINHFKHCQIEDHMFFHSEELDEEGRLANFFWRDGISKLDYDCFGDVVIFDTTYRTNKYNMIFAPFVGINHHKKSIFFACAFLLHETTETFIWLFQTFLEAMGNQAPKTIFTDQCQAMANAIKEVFPTTCHRLCSWHISKNATQKLGNLYADCEFKSMFNKCFYECETELEFETTWQEMIRRFNLSNNNWINSLYQVRQKWCPAFSLGTFTLRTKSTQRSESMNNVLHKMSCKAMTLREFVHHYEEQCEKMRLAERYENYRCKTGSVQIRVIDCKMLKQAADVYTIIIYYLFEDEFISSLAVHMEHVSSVDTIHTYHVCEEGRSKHYDIVFNSSSCTVVCSCKMFESVGWLCRHALKVLNVWGVTKIPSQYILNRWKKCAKDGSHNFDDSTSKRKPSLTLERNNLLQQSYRAINHLVLTDEGKKVAKKKVEEMLEEAKKLMEHCNLNTNNDESSLGDAIGSLDEVHVLDPPRVRAKGLTNARIKSHLERKKRKQKRGQSTKPNKECFSQNYFGVPHLPVVSHPPMHLFDAPMHANFHPPGGSNGDLSLSWNFEGNSFHYSRMLHDNEVQYGKIDENVQR